MEKFTYTIFDGPPSGDGQTSWPSYTDMEIRARNPEIASKKVRKVARSEGRTCGEYRADDVIYWILRDKDGNQVAEGQVALGGPGLPKPCWKSTDQ